MAGAHTMETAFPFLRFVRRLFIIGDPFTVEDVTDDGMESGRDEMLPVWKVSVSEVRRTVVITGTGSGVSQVAHAGGECCSPTPERIQSSMSILV